MGRIAAGLLQLGGGSALVLGAVAGIGAIAAAYKLASQEADDLKASTDKLNQSYRDILAGASPIVALQNRITVALEEQTRAQADLDRLSQRNPLLGGRGSPGEVALAQNRLDAATRVVSALRSLRPDMVDAARLIAIQFQQGAAALARGGVFQALRPGFTAPAFGTGGLGLGGGPTTFANIRGNQPRFGADPFAPEQFAPREFFVSDLEKAITKARPPAPDAGRLAAEAVALLGALKQGGIGNIVGGAGGALSALSGIKGLGGLSTFGIIGTALGGVFNLFDHSEERRHKELLKAMTDLKPIMEATRAAVYLVDSRTGETRQLQYAIGRREDRDAIDRNGEGL